MEIKIDTSTLPKDGSKVKWQTYDDINNESWKEGLYSEDEGGYGLFLYNVQEDQSTSDWDIMWHVHHWEYLE